MNIIQKIINVLTENIVHTVILICSIVLFAIFSDGLLNGIITAISALIIYVCIELLYKEYKKLPKKVKKISSKKKSNKSK